MENKINIAELLKDCPRGMELDCTIWDSEAKVFLNGVLDYDDFSYPIEVTVKYNGTEYIKSFNKYGAFKGSMMAVYRILRCNPFSKGGYDPVP